MRAERWSPSTPGRTRAPTRCSSSAAGRASPISPVGDHIRIIRQVDQQGATSYAFYDYERTWPLIALAAAFAVVIVAVGALARTARARSASWSRSLVLVVFLLPALRDGASAVPAALVASAAILYAVIYLAHGVSLRTSAALLGTLTSLLLAAVLVLGGNRTGASDRTVGGPEQRGRGVPGQRVDHRAAAGRIHHRLARRAQRRHRHAGVDGVRTRRRRRRQLRAVRFSSAPCGWAATTSPARSTPWCSPTRVVRCRCCCCSAWPNRSLGDVLTSESVAIEIARSAVGGIALALSVPLTTAIAAALATPHYRSSSSSR